MIAKDQSGGHTEIRQPPFLPITNAVSKGPGIEVAKYLLVSMLTLQNGRGR